MSPFPARWHDGRSAIAHAVEAALSADGLALTGPSLSAPIAIPYADLTLIDEGVDLRLGRKSEPDARLILPRSAQAALFAAARHLRPKVRRAKHAALIVGLTLGAVALFLLVFVGAPRAAGPLAAITPREAEERFGRNVEVQIKALMRPCAGASSADAKAALRPLVDRFVAARDPGFPIQIDFVDVAEPNALTLPGGRILITRGLVETLEAPDQLAAILAHELGHVAHRDGLAALYRNAGLGLFLEAITGGAGLAQQMVLISGQLTDLAASRDQEQAADAYAFALMSATGQDPAALARAFQRFEAAGQAKEKDKAKSGAWRTPVWLSSHPLTPTRIAAAQQAAKPATAKALSEQAWAQVRAACAP